MVFLAGLCPCRGPWDLPYLFLAPTSNQRQAGQESHHLAKVPSTVVLPAVQQPTSRPPGLLLPLQGLQYEAVNAQRATGNGEPLSKNRLGRQEGSPRGRPDGKIDTLKEQLLKPNPAGARTGLWALLLHSQHQQVDPSLSSDHLPEWPAAGWGPTWGEGHPSWRGLTVSFLLLLCPGNLTHSGQGQNTAPGR